MGSRLSPMGIDVEFPYAQPYQAQRALIAKSMAAFTKSENALLESPTGTGKTLSLLASSLAYQSYVKKQQEQLPTTLDTKSPYFKEKQTQVLDEETKSTAQRVYYTSRSHDQLNQVVSELKRLKFYHPKMVILGSRSALCINDSKRNNEDLDSMCRKNMNNSSFCSYNRNPAVPPDFYPGGDLDKYNSNELQDYCREKNICPYFLTRALLRSAEYVLCPYNYIIDAKIRLQMKLNIAQSIILFDEGHNIEQSCRDAASLELNIKEVSIMHAQLQALTEDSQKLLIGEKLYDSAKHVFSFVDKILQWFEKNISERKWEKNQKTTEKSEYYTYPDPSLVLSGWGLNKSSWDVFSQDFDLIIKTNEKNQNEDAFISDLLATVVSNLSNTFSYIFKQDATDDFNLIVTGFEDTDVFTLKLLCMSPGLTFQTISNQTHSIILTSGTLSPLDQYESELRVRFAHKLSANHSIDPSQVLSLIIPCINGVGLSSANKELTNYKTSKDIFGQLGKIITTISRSVPDGVLLFFPSQRAMNQCWETWDQPTKNEIEKEKKIFIEKSGKRKRGEPEPRQLYTKNINQGKGGILMGVCRGRISEGIDFRDKQARAVVLFGIPYPSFFSPEISLKRSYNESHCLKPGMAEDPNSFYTSNGQDWYKAQAFRAISQAVGRCIRHQNDYGSIILIDQRFPAEKQKFPQWMQHGLKANSDITDLGKLGKLLERHYIMMREKFPQSVSGPTEINENEHVFITHSECITKLAKVIKLDKSASYNSNSPGLLGVLGIEDKNSTVALERVRTGDCIFNSAKKGDGIWIPEDEAFYQPILCTCGKIIGVHIRAANEDHASDIGSDIFIVDKCNVTQNSLSDKMSNFVKKPLDIQMSAGEGGQRKLSFV